MSNQGFLLFLFRNNYGQSNTPFIVRNWKIVLQGREFYTYTLRIFWNFSLSVVRTRLIILLIYLYSFYIIIIIIIDILTT